MVLFIRILFIFLVHAGRVESFDKVVIWGHKLHTHTHSYIHNAFYIAFKHLGYDTYWFDNQSEVGDFDFSNALFITEGQVDQSIPLRNDSLYVLHNCYSLQYQEIPARNKINIQVYTDDILSSDTAFKVEPCIYYDLTIPCLYMPWATDLLPEEIEEIKGRLSEFPIQNKIYWIGTIGEGLFGNKYQLDPFIQACEENQIAFLQKINLGIQEAAELIQRSYMAPAIVGEWQQKKGYIPCRIFKNISMGKMGVTNSQRVYELFEGKIVYNPDTYQLFYDAKERIETTSVEEIIDLMDFVKTKHTYLNRISTILHFFKCVQAEPRRIIE